MKNMTQEEKWKGQMVRYGLERWGPGRKRAYSFHVLSITHTFPTSTSMCSQTQKLLESHHVGILWEFHYKGMIDEIINHW